MAKARKDIKGRVLHKGETYRKSDDSYMYKYVDPLGRKKYIYAKDLLALRDRERILLRDQLDGLDIYIAGKATVNYVFDRYMSAKTELRNSTKSGYLYTYDRYVRESFGEKKLADIKYSEVLSFLLKLRNENELSISTVDTVQHLLKSAFELAVRDDIIRNNPCNGVMKEIRKKTGGKCGIRHALSVEEQEAFIDYVESSPIYDRWYTFFQVLLGTGMRIGEAISLRWDDIDFDNRKISVNHSLACYWKYDEDGNGYPVREIHLPKTEAGIRTIPMLDVVYDALEEQRDYSKEAGGCITNIDGMDDFAFFNIFNEILTPQTVNIAISGVIEHYNNEEVINAKREHREPIILPHFTCHHLRHTFCTRLCEADVNLKIIQMIMGHKNIHTTLDIYSDVSESKQYDALKEFAEKFRNLF